MRWFAGRLKQTETMAEQILWKELVIEMRRQWKKTTTTSVAIVELEKMRQGRKPVKQFCREFEWKADKIEGLAEMYQCRIFLRCLDGALQKELIAKDFDSYQEWKEAAIKAESKVQLKESRSLEWNTNQRNQVPAMI